MLFLKRIRYYLKLKSEGGYYIMYWNDSEPPYFTYFDKNSHFRRQLIK